MLTQALIVTATIAFWLFTMAALADSLVRLMKGTDTKPVLCTVKAGLIAAPFIIVAGVSLTHLLREASPEPGNPSLPCGHGTDYDTRDGLCYKFVPLKFQRR